MGQREKFAAKLLSGMSDNNIPFEEICKLLCSLNFSLRIKGSHHIFYRDDIEDILNIQPKDRKVKPYQVKQIRKIILKHGLGDEHNV